MEIEAFKAGTEFVLNNKYCKVTESKRVQVFYASGYDGSFDNVTWHTARKETLRRFLSAGLLTIIPA